MTHLDTSFLVDFLREKARRGAPGPASALLDELSDEALAVSVFVACELAAGVELAQRPRREEDRVRTILSVVSVEYPDERFAPAYGKLLAQTRQAGETIATMDLLIATTAILANATLVTRNARDFGRAPGLVVRGY